MRKNLKSKFSSLFKKDNLGKLRLLLGIFIILLLAIWGITTLRYYGIHVDDFSLAKYGELVSYRIVDPRNEAYLSYGHMKYYSPFFEVGTHLIISFFGVEVNTLSFFYFRKLLIYTTFVIGVIYYYLILRKFFTTRIAFLSTASVYLIPSFFGYASITSKEIPLLSFTIVGVYYLLKYFSDHNLKSLLLHSVFIGIAIAIRPSALTFLPITILIIVWVIIIKSKNTKTKKMVKAVCYSIIFSIVVAIPSLILDPYLREDPVNRYPERLEFMSNFDMGGSIMIMGEIMEIADSKTVDIFVLGIKKLPEYFIILIILGTVLSLYNLFFKRDHKTRLVTLTFLWLLIPLLLIFVNQTKFYNFRHLLVFLPPLGILAAFAVDFLIRHQNIFLRRISTLFIIIGLIVSAYNIFNLFPYEITYFNKVSGGLAENSKNYTNYPEGLAEAEAIKNLCVNQNSTFKLSGPFVELYIPYYCPGKAIFVDNYAESDFIITYDFYEKLRNLPSNAKLVSAITREGAFILNTYKLD